MTDPRPLTGTLIAATLTPAADSEVPAHLGVPLTLDLLTGVLAAAPHVTALGARSVTLDADVHALTVAAERHVPGGRGAPRWCAVPGPLPRDDHWTVQDPHADITATDVTFRGVDGQSGAPLATPPIPLDALRAQLRRVTGDAGVSSGRDGHAPGSSPRAPGAEEPQADPTGDAGLSSARDSHGPEAGHAAPDARLHAFDLVDWAVVDSFTRVEVRGPHDLTNQVLRAFPGLSYDDAHAAATTAWAGQFVMTGTVTVEPSWG